MDCTHPVLYDRDGGLYCHICGALISANDAGDKQEWQKENAPEGPKKAVKRKAAK